MEEEFDLEKERKEKERRELERKEKEKIEFEKKKKQEKQLSQSEQITNKIYINKEQVKSTRTVNYKTYGEMNEENLSNSYAKRGLSTKIKIYKCVIWKNNDPTLDENDIKKIIRRTGSLIFNKESLIIKLPKTFHQRSNSGDAKN